MLIENIYFISNDEDGIDIIQLKDILLQMVSLVIIKDKKHPKVLFIQPLMTNSKDTITIPYTSLLIPFYF
ncbi:hypothetical protein BA1DRAFT_03488 [Photorhabdus aegyptia]|uniref:Uncharacterized protein n=1 Tax=Photorhabdus aegyptia TaxID=2805098 RepID=A0A022PHJ6_9GAMM|nr:hypothetical protein BA1DRAFT_03488 [Photorhabdus aegyptia]